MDLKAERAAIKAVSQITDVLIIERTRWASEDGPCRVESYERLGGDRLAETLNEVLNEGAVQRVLDELYDVLPPCSHDGACRDIKPG